jgi:hypothetical protein
MIAAVGNAPSSGSTFLADLLDSLPFAVCGPEIGLFSSIKYFNEFHKIKRNNLLTSKSPMIYQNRQRLLVEDLWAYGIDSQKTKSLYRDSNSFVEFCNKLFSEFASFRKKDCELFFEKTPQNIHCARKFLETFEDGFFLHIVRNPLFVYKSLIQRKFQPYIAANTWLIDVSQAYRLRKHPRLIEIKYETLIQEPAETIGKILKRMGIKFETETIIDLYKHNQYRKEYTTKIEAWEIKQYGAVGNANRKKITDGDSKTLTYMFRTKIPQRYANIFDLSAVKFKDLAQHYGYKFDRSIQNNGSQPLRILLDIQARKSLLKKFIIDYVYRESRFLDILAYLKPIEIQ